MNHGLLINLAPIAIAVFVIPTLFEKFRRQIASKASWTIVFFLFWFAILWAYFAFAMAITSVLQDAPNIVLAGIYIVISLAVTFMRWFVGLAK